MKLIETTRNHVCSTFDRIYDTATKAYIAAETAATTKSTRAKRFNQLVLVVSLVFIAAPAMANEFSGFLDAIENFAGGNFAIGISILALVLGALMGLGKMTVWPALTGFAVAAVFAIGPYLIKQIFTVLETVN